MKVDPDSGELLLTATDEKFLMVSVIDPDDPEAKAHLEKCRPVLREYFGPPPSLSKDNRPGANRADRRSPRRPGRRS
jgi:hypothetical protein